MIMAAFPSRNIPTMRRNTFTTIRKRAGVSRNVIIICASSCGMRSFVRIHAKVDAAPKSIATSDVRAENYGPGMAPDIGWKESNGSWFYVKSDRTSARAEVLNINGKKYWFDADGKMAKGWRQDTSGSWYFMEDSGAMNSSGWLKYNGLWYYLGSDGKMLTNTTTPDGYTLNGDGVWVS